MPERLPLRLRNTNTLQQGASSARACVHKAAGWRWVETHQGTLPSCVAGLLAGDGEGESMGPPLVPVLDAEVEPLLLSKAAQVRRTHQRRSVHPSLVLSPCGAPHRTLRRCLACYPGLESIVRLTLLPPLLPPPPLPSSSHAVWAPAGVGAAPCHT